MSSYFISGIQQVGIGTENLKRSWKWYIDMFQTDIRILEDDSVAELMLPYTGNQAQKRHACIAVNLQGGGGLEIWQYSERKPKTRDFDIQIADLGVFLAKIKARNVKAFHQEIKAKYSHISDILITPDGIPCFYILDPFGNYFQIVEDAYVFVDRKRQAGGVVGAMIGVRNIEKALPVYQDILGYDTIVYDQIGVFEDWQFLRGGSQRYRRVLLEHSQKRKGAFAAMFGPSHLELVVALEREPKKIYEGRFWGDPGFIQICYDVTHMQALKDYCREKGFPFTVDSCASQSSFDMGEATGHFTYIEDPDGTLIEFVETHKIPLIKVLGLHINLMKRNREKVLPKFLFRLMGINKVTINE
ncbi:MAG: VOC family protein [Bacteroidales bacterium]|jgi:catechol 2,3-dioxygenase-like lactoylglutathione lyase family enzyme|nr:VOC family protein [Bacteroidales bacterium]MDD3331312.1 VOC family protein [Bacteroidales bacterium]MDD4045232.1 VOC family protein [Bacteroidales bacterium]MDD4582287.1 VOC family protein [Bacteroidales bacterium]MDX9890482.1 VOC family protein [Bacteroidales bacterium]